MKKRFTILASLSVTAMAFAAGLGLVEESKAVKATTEETTFYIDVSDVKENLWTSASLSDVGVYTWGGSNPATTYIYASGSDDNKGALTQVSVEDKTYLTFDMSQRDYTGFLVYCWNKDNAGNMSNDVSFADFSSGENLVTLVNSGSWSTKHSVNLGTLVVGTQYTVTKLAVEFDGGVAGEPADWGLGTDSVSEGATYNAPSGIQKNLEHFVGWYSDVACTTEFVSKVVDADFTIYAKYEKLSVDSYVYWVSESADPIFDHFYAFGEYETAAWPGDAIADFEVSGVLHFNGLEQKIYKIPVPSGADFKFILLKDGGAQTYDIDVTLGAGYYTYLKESESKYSWDANVDAGKALDLLLRAESVRNAVEASGGIKQYSVCGISAEDAQSLCEEYNALTDEQRTFVNATSTYTYDRVDPSTETLVSYYDIFEQLSAIAGGVSLSGHSFFNGFLGIDGSSASIIIIIVSITSLAAFAFSMIIVKKNRKKDR